MASTPGGTEWERHGVADGPAIVLIHGLGLNRAAWQWTIPALADRYDIIAYDLYGHGESAAPPDIPSLSLFSLQLVDVLDAAGFESAAIVGFSLGGMIARRFAQDHPERVGGLVILNSPYRRSPEAQKAVEDRVEQAKKEGPDATVEAALQRWFTDAFREAKPDTMELVRSWVKANDPSVYPTVYRVLAEGVKEVSAPQPPLRVPALALTADEDFGNSPEMSRCIAAEIEGGECLILPGLRHMALVEDPDAVNTLVRAFLDRNLI